MLIESLLAYHFLSGAILHGPPFGLRESVVTNNNEYRCLVRNLYFEGRGEGLVGQAYIVKTVLNRVRDNKHPKSICGVIYQPRQFSWVKQLPKEKHRVPQTTIQEKELLSSLELLSTFVIGLDRLGVDFTQGSKYYHSTRIKPRWDYNKIEKTDTIGGHVFYRSKESK